MSQKKHHPSGESSPTPSLSSMLWIGSGVLFVILLMVLALFPEMTWLSVLVALALLGSIGGLVFQNQKALRSRSASFGLNSGITVLLVLGIVGILNFMASKYPGKLDLTANKKHTLSEQTVKIVKTLGKPLKMTLFTPLSQKERYRPLLDNYKSLNSKIEVEYVDPMKELARAKAAGLRSANTLFLAYGTKDEKPKEDRLDDLTEEKITNALIRLTKNKNSVLCVVTGHGEKNFTATDADGYDLVRKALVAQSYDVKPITLLEDKKVPESCDALAVVGPTKSYFEPEVKMIKDYLDEGGRAFFAFDLNLKGKEFVPELMSLMGQWYIKPLDAMIIDPFTKLFGRDATFALAISKLGGYSKESPITRDFVADSIFPIARPLEALPGVPAELKVHWVAQTTPNAVGVMDLSQLKKGEIHVNPKVDKHGPLAMVMTSEGKKKEAKPKRDTRLVVFGTSGVATNQHAPEGGNLDLVVNSISWLMEDENLISIRAKEDTAAKIEMSQKTANFVFLVSTFVLPLLIAACGIGVWAHRRKL